MQIAYRWTAGRDIAMQVTGNGDTMRRGGECRWRTPLPAAKRFFAYPAHESGPTIAEWTGEEREVGTNTLTRLLIPPSPLTLLVPWRQGALVPRYAY